MKKTAAILILLLGINACKTKPHTADCVKAITDFVEYQNTDCRNYSDKDWEIMNDIFLDLLKDANKYKDELNLKQKMQITSASTKYVLLQVHSGKYDLIRDIKLKNKSKN